MTTPPPLALAFLAALALSIGHVIAKAQVNHEIAIQEVRW